MSREKVARDMAHTGLASTDVAGTAPPRVGSLGALDGYVVLDVTQYLSGPFATLMLSALGATVIKIEPPNGDGNRHVPPFSTREGLQWHRLDDDDIGLNHLKRNAGKQSVCVDLKSPEGRLVFNRLVENADAIVQNSRPGVAERLGMTASELAAMNPAIVSVDIDGLGTYAEPGDQRGVTDTVAQAMSGLMAITGERDGPPTRCGAPIADESAGLYAAMAVVAGLLQRDGRPARGAGGHFSVSLMSSLSSLMWDENWDVYQRAGNPDRNGNGTARAVPFNTYPTQDGEWVAIAAFSGEEWRRLTLATGIAEFEEPALEDPATRVQERVRVEALLTAWTVVRTSAEVLAELAIHHCTAAPVRNLKDIVTDERLKEHLLYAVQDPRFGGVDASAGAFAIHGDGRAVGPFTMPAPELGADTDYVLTRVAGFAAAEVSQLREQGVIR